MLLLFFLDPNRPCMKIMGLGALDEGFEGSWRSYASEIRGAVEYVLLHGIRRIGIAPNAANRGRMVGKLGSLF